ncbi:MAG: hypothetical protein Q7W54_14755, partial [Bacteroidota bacterium]|nr:hypothetical protein [Bacteroidota bacterium]
EMYTPGNILYFKPFVFPNGDLPKNKYFIILQTIGSNVLIASLPTSKDFIPHLVQKKHGCIDVPQYQVNCYCFQPGKIVTKNNFSFPVETFVYGYQVDQFDKTKFDSLYVVDGVDYEIIGELKKDEYLSLINCIKNSASVSRKIRRWLGEKI